MAELLKIELLNYGRKDLINGDLLNSEPVDISNCINYDDDFEITQDRDGLNGIVLERSFPQTFYNEAYELIRRVYKNNGTKAYCQIRISERDSSIYTKYYELGVFELDFSTLEIERDSLTIDVISYNISNIIQSNSGTRYDIYMSDFSNVGGRHVIVYPHINLEVQRGLNFVLNQTLSSISTNSTYYTPYITINNPNTQLIQEEIFIKGVEFGTYPDERWFRENDGYFLENISDTNKNVELDINLQFTVDNYQYPVVRCQLIDRVLTFDANGNPAYTNNILRNTILAPGATTSFIYNDTIRVIAGHQLCLVILLEPSPTPGSVIQIGVSVEQNTFELRFLSSHQGRNGDGTSNLQSYTPDALLQVLINKMTNSNSSTPQYRGVIEWTLIDNNRFAIVPSEVLRGLVADHALHTSFNDFKDWMFSLGYVINYTDNYTLTFVRYTENFSRSAKTIAIDESNVNNLQIISDPEYVYTNVEIGYNIEKYENENGRFDPFGTFSYSTGIIRNEENKLSIISPYRADVIGFELLTWQSNKESQGTNSTISDNDVFVVYGSINSSTGLFDIDFSNPITFNDTSITLFNWYLLPSYLAIRHGTLFKVSSNLLKFTATDANRTAMLNGATIYIDIDLQIYFKLFEPINMTFDCIYIKDVYTLSNRYSIIEFTYLGETYRGFLKNSIRRFGRENTSELTIYPINFLN